jgi:hypothetical protein
LNTSLANLVLPQSLPAAGRFEWTKGRMVRDLVNGSTFRFVGSPEPEVDVMKFEYAGTVIEGELIDRTKYPDRPKLKGSPDNPGLMISAYRWSVSFNSHKMVDREFNSRLVLYMTNMIAFRNSVCFSYAVFLWSDYSVRPQPKVLATFDMPSDDELLKISATWRNI